MHGAHQMGTPFHSDLHTVSLSLDIVFEISCLVPILMTKISSSSSQTQSERWSIPFRPLHPPVAQDCHQQGVMDGLKSNSLS